ncbi:MAG: serine/threonine-protein kinase [Pseudomonadota bacterium]|nr:serine/threonine-protein kinase [Pseudomonadota bacterium]
MLAAGQLVLERYVIDSVIQRGGMGVVYRGHHHRLQTPVAIKTMLTPDDPMMALRFAREAELMSRIRHPNVVSILEYATLEEGPCIVMEFIEGTTVSGLLKEGGAIPWPRAVAYMIGVCSGLAALHLSEIVHRDLKPSNIVVTDGSPPMVKLLDLGIARSLSPDTMSLTTTGGHVGTFSYMSPEQLRGESVTARSDLYSASILFYEMLTGVPLAPRDNVVAVYQRLNKRVSPPVSPPHVPAVPDALAAIILSGLELDPGARPLSARTYAGLLDRARREHPVVQRDPSEAPPARAAPPAASSGERAGDGGAITASTRGRFVLVARLPKTSFTLQGERSWLQAQLVAGCKSYVIGTNLWLVIGASQPGRTTASTATAIADALAGRYGADSRACWRPVAEDFRVSQAAIVGAQPFPSPLKEMIEEAAEA